MIALPELIDHAMPYAGPCGFCGDDDKRHRILDAIAELLRAGDTADRLADDYGLTEEVVEQIGEHWNGKRQAWLEERHVADIATNTAPWPEGPWSLATCSCGWFHGAYKTRSSARRAWRRHLERAK